tara:strand:+ start:276 stop:782 length:507 start_codon:yes stop_codon:yes gene_type:complete
MLLSFKLLLVALAISTITGAYIYITDLQNKLEKTTLNLATATLNQTTLEREIDAQQTVIEQQIKDFNDITNANTNLQAKNKILQKEISNLDKKFNKINATGKKRDIGSLAVSRSKTIEKIINTASANALRCLEIASGAILTEKELNATKKSQINPECPSLANPNYINY